MLIVLLFVVVCWCWCCLVLFLSLVASGGGVAVRWCCWLSLSVVCYYCLWPWLCHCLSLLGAVVICWCLMLCVDDGVGHVVVLCCWCWCSLLVLLLLVIVGVGCCRCALL